MEGNLVADRRKNHGLRRKKQTMKEKNESIIGEIWKVILSFHAGSHFCPKRDLSFRHSINPSIHQSVSQSITSRINQTIHRPIKSQVR